MTAKYQIQSREHLLSALAEASELEHTLMCVYLYAAFSLKADVSDGLRPEQLAAVQRWKKAILEVAVQEMTHLALVGNITTAVGGTAHFFRPGLPVRPGYFPSGFTVELAPFDLAAIEHFIFLERPLELHVKRPEEFTPDTEYTRESPRGRLMAHPGEYETVGELYDSIASAIQYLETEIGTEKLFCGSLSLQITPDDVSLPGLTLINDGKSALNAIQTIVEQGEGARTTEGSHFEKFKEIKREYEALLKQDASFEPAFPSVRNPVMRKPIETENIVWVNHPHAALLLDVGNAVYGLMLRCLLQVYSGEKRPPENKASLLNAAFSLMHAVGVVGSLLPHFPAAKSQEGRAGLSFSINRYFNAIELDSERKILRERLQEIEECARKLEAICHHSPLMPAQLEKLLGMLKDTEAQLGPLPL